VFGWYGGSDHLWAGFNAGYFTKVVIGKNVTIIDDSFNNHNTIQRFDCLPLVAPATYEFSMHGYPVPLHIKPSATGYDVAPWTNTAIFSQIIRDL